MILAGITIVYVFGDNGVFGQATDAKLKIDIAKYQEMLETAKAPIIIDGLGTFDLDGYFKYLEEQEIINDKDTDVIDNGDGTYEVTTKPGYVFEITLVPTPEKPTDVEITYLGQAGKLPPRVKNIKVTGKTGTSLEIEVEVARLEDGKLSYYYKEVDEPESAYKEVKKDVVDFTATIGNLSEGKIYHIKVVAKNKKGENALVVTEAIQQLVKTITLDQTTATMKSNDTLQLTASVLPENVENKTLEWSSSDESIATVSATGLITAKTTGDVIIMAKATDGSEVTASCNIIVKIPVESITLNRTTTQVEQSKTTTLIATINPSNATNKEVTWSSSNTSIATVSSTGVITGKAIGTVTITAQSVDDTIKTASCTVKVTDETNWAEIAEMAKVIANDNTVTNNSSQATVTVNGESKTIKVGDILKVKYNGEIRRVRVLGFKHDDLVDTGAYGGNHSKASISFEFYDFMTGNTTMRLNASGTEGGWASTTLRTNLNGSGSSIGGLGANLSNKEYIKQVKKKYIKTYNSASSVTTSNDYLWLLSCSEIFKDGYQSGAYGYAITSEGSQYKYYKGVTEVWNVANENRIKYNAAGSAQYWWLRSPYYYSATSFCGVGNDGYNCFNIASVYYGVAPGFCI